MEVLSEELLLHIFDQLLQISDKPVLDLMNCYACNKFWNRVCEDGSLWKTIASERFPIGTKNFTHQDMMLQFKNLVKTKNAWRKEPKKVMLENHTFKANTFQIIKGNEVYDKTKIYSGAADCRIIEWDMGIERTNLMKSRVIASDTEDNGPITCLLYDHYRSLIFIGQSDGVIRAWNTDEIPISNNLEGHESSIVKLKFLDPDPYIYNLITFQCLVSASSDGTLRIWNRDTFQCVRQFVGHSYGITDFEILQFPNRQLILSASDDNTCVVWDLHQLQPLYVFPQPQNCGPGKCLSICGDKIALGCYSGTIILFQCSKEGILSVQNVLEGHSATVNSIQLEENYMVSGSSDTNVLLWKKSENVWIPSTITKHAGPVTSIKFDDYKIVSGSADCTVVVSTIKGETLYVQEQHMNRVNKVDFVENMLVSCSNDGTLIVSTFPIEEPVRIPDEQLTPLLKMRNNIARTFSFQGRKPVVLVACGAYSPPHVKHVEVLQFTKNYLEIMGYAVVLGLMVPSGDSYQKIGLAPSRHRLAMCKLFAEDSDWLEVSQWEAAQSSFILPHDVVQHVANLVEWPKVEVMFVCGADLLIRLRGYLSILLKYGIVCVNRPDASLEDFFRYNEEIQKSPDKNRLLLLDNWESSDMSSTKIRTRIAKAQSVDGMTHPKVVQYMQEHHLYR